MKALFVTTDSVDCYNHVRAWNSAFPVAEHHTFNLKKIRNDWQIIEKAQEIKPDVIFYIGAVSGNVPRGATFTEIRKTAPLINLCSDAADSPWHGILRNYKKYFDLQVAIDGASEAPVNLSTVTPIDPYPFKSLKKDIRCGFSGTVGRWNTRSEIINALEWFGELTVRKRERWYEDHAGFLSRCQMILNTSWTGSGMAHHIKGRVIEAGYAKAALLEYVESPIAEWFSSDCYILWKDPKEAAEIIKNISDEEIQFVAGNLHKEVTEKYTAKKIYQDILNNVHSPITRKTA